MRRQILTSGFSILVVRVLGALLSVVVTIVLSRHLGPQGLGYYAYLVAVIMLCTVPISTGWGTLVLRGASQAHHHGDWGQVHGMSVRGAQGASLIAGMFVAIGLASIYLWPGLITEDSRITIVVLAALILLFDQLSALRASILRGLDWPVIAQLPEMVLRPAVMLISFFTLVLFSDHSVLTMAFVALFIASMVNLVIGMGLLWNRRPASYARDSATYDMKNWLSSYWPLLGSSGFIIVNGYVDTIALGAIAGAYEVGIYRVAFQFALVAGLGYTALNILAGQRFAFLKAAGDQNQLHSTATFLARLSVVTSIIPFALLWLFGEPLIKLLFGSEYLPALIPMLILSCGHIINSMAGMARFFLIMHQYESVVLRHSLVSLGLNILLCPILIYMWGTMGAAIATVLSGMVLNISLCLSAYVLERFDTSFLGMADNKTG